MGVYGNGRAFEYLLTKMYAHQLPEVRTIASKIHRELTPPLGSFLERLMSEKGRRYVNYLQATEKDVRALFGKNTEIQETEAAPRAIVKLLSHTQTATSKAVAAILFPYSKLSWGKLYSAVREFPQSKISQIIETYVGRRQGRWHKVGKAFEEVDYTFEIVSDWGVYKDLQRHRILTNLRQNFTTEHGFEVPNDIVEAQLEKEYRRALESSAKAYRKIAQKWSDNAQYLVCHGHLGRWRVKLNLREAFHLCELRSSPAGHPNYRMVAQEIHRQIKKADPLLGAAMRFVNYTEPNLERLSAEVRIEEKLASSR